MHLKDTLEILSTMWKYFYIPFVGGIVSKIQGQVTHWSLCDRGLFINLLIIITPRDPVCSCMVNPTKAQCCFDSLIGISTQNGMTFWIPLYSMIICAELSKNWPCNARKTFKSPQCIHTISIHLPWKKPWTFI